MKRLFAFCLLLASPVLAGTNEIRIEVAPEELATATATPIKYNFKSARAKINGGGWLTAELNIRGQNCLKAPRRCYGLKLEKKVRLEGRTGLEERSFNLVSMWQDRGYVSSKIGYDMFRALGLFDLRSEYAEVFVNDVSQGLYLVTEKPKRAVERVVPDPFVARRGMQVRFETAEGVKPESGRTDAEFLHAFKALYADLRLYKGAELAKRIDERLNLTSYLQWLAVNSLLTNGDYTDEVFFFADIKSKTVRFEVFPWDMDDLFMAPHSGLPNRLRAIDLQNGILYSYENPLDIKIGDDPVLYQRLRDVTRELVTRRATDQVILDVIRGVEEDLLPYLERSTVLEGGRLDSARRSYTKAGILKILSGRRDRIFARRDVLKVRADAPFTPRGPVQPPPKPEAPLAAQPGTAAAPNVAAAPVKNP